MPEIVPVTIVKPGFEYRVHQLFTSSNEARLNWYGLHFMIGRFDDGASATTERPSRT